MKLASYRNEVNKLTTEMRNMQLFGNIYSSSISGMQSYRTKLVSEAGQ